MIIFPLVDARETFIKWENHLVNDANKVSIHMDESL